MEGGGGSDSSRGGDGRVGRCREGGRRELEVGEHCLSSSSCWGEFLPAP